MVRLPQPWFWSERNGWYVTKNGQRHFLGEHSTTAPRPRQTRGKWNPPDAIRNAFHELMTAKPSSPQSTHAVSNCLTVAVICEKYLDWCEKHREPRTYEGYRWHLQNFITAIGATASLSAIDLRPFHIIEWLDSHPDWGQTYRRNAIAAVKRVYSWAEELGYLPSNPIRKLAKPAAKRRERFITLDDWNRIRKSYRANDPFRDLLEFAWETGCRPQEARHIEPLHVHLDKAVIAIPPPEAKGKKKWRLIRLEGRSLELVRNRLVETTGKLFSNADGNPWTSSAVNCRFGRLKAKLGVRYSAYLFRHGFATRLLVKGVDHLTVAELLGHSDGTMLAKVYQHLDQSDSHLREALRKASGEPQMTEG
jgi:integrase/recombinase XerC